MDEEERTASREEPKQSFLILLGLGAGLTGLLADIVGVATAFFKDTGFSANVLTLAFAGFMLGVAGYFLGARRLGAAAAIGAVAMIPIGALVTQLLWL